LIKVIKLFLFHASKQRVIKKEKPKIEKIKLLNSGATINMAKPEA
jgi:hypothetical protein